MTNVADLELPASPNGKDVIVPPSRAEWRTWLSAEADRSDGLWLVYRKKSSSLDGPNRMVGGREIDEERPPFGSLSTFRARL